MGYRTAGRETLAAIEHELAQPTLSAAEAPLLEISEAPAGRDTLAAIADELAESTTRPRQNTLPYGDRISNAPGASAPSRPPRPRPATSPPLPSKGAKTAKVEKVEKAATVEKPAVPRSKPAPAGVEIFELLTFIIRGTAVGDLSTEPLRRRFIEAHLLHRVPSGSLDDVERIEVTPWTAKGTMVLRVWVRG